MKQTAVEYIKKRIEEDSDTSFLNINWDKFDEIIDQAKEMEKNNTDNKVIHFAEWLTKKHTTTLITLYEQFEEEYYNETFKSE